MKVDTIVVGYDGSSNARLAVEAAIDLVSDRGVVHVVTAHDAPSASEMAALMEALPGEFRTNIDLLAGPEGNLRNAQLMLTTRGVENEGHFIEEKPAAAILDLAEKVNADMIIVGSRGLGRGTRFIRGSVSSRIAAHARTSFMIIHQDDE